MKVDKTQTNENQAIVWRRLVGTKFLDAWLERLVGVPPERRVVTMLSGKKSARIEVYVDRLKTARELTRQFGGEVRVLKRSAWWKSQERNFFRVIGNKLCVTSDPALLPSQHRELPTLVVPAGFAFGTGEHPTTMMCLHELIRVSRTPECSVLDVGTGTGILAMAACLLGCRATGIDHDPNAIREAKKNALVNGVKRGITWKCSEAKAFAPKEKTDVLIANLFLGPILEMLPAFEQWLKPEGRFIFSGVLHRQEEELMEHLDQRGWQVEKRKRIGKWICLTGSLKKPLKNKRKSL